MLTLFELGLVAHLVADWLMQNHWMAVNKSNLRHPAAWVQSGIHAVALGLVLGWQAGLALGFVYLLIDTGIPQTWRQRIFRQTTTGTYAIPTAIWGDWGLHITTIALWVALAAPLF